MSLPCVLIQVIRMWSKDEVAINKSKKKITVSVFAVLYIIKVPELNMRRRIKVILTTFLKYPLIWKYCKTSPLKRPHVKNDPVVSERKISLTIFKTTPLLLGEK